MQERHIDRSRYFEELAQTSKKYYIPYLKDFFPEISNSQHKLSVLEIGCGEGGTLVPFAEIGHEVVGVDLAENKIKNARLYFEEKGLEGQFISSDIFEIESFEGKFDIILIHDVIEHIHDKVEFLKKSKKFLAKNGIIFIGFPVWRMPFGGHQQISSNKIISHIPYLHLLPKGLYRYIISHSGDKQRVINDLLDIKETGINMGKFKKLIIQSGYKTLASQAWLINPHYEIKFHLKPLKLHPILSSIPCISNFITTSYWWIGRL